MCIYKFLKSIMLQVTIYDEISRPKKKKKFHFLVLFLNVHTIIYFVGISGELNEKIWTSWENLKTISHVKCLHFQS